MVRLVFVFLMLIFLLTACTSKYSTHATRYPPAGNFDVPDYSRIDSWAAHPWKKDPSDSLPFALRYEEKDSIADVFFIYPTTYTGSKKGWNAEIDDLSLNVKTDYT